MINTLRKQLIVLFEVEDLEIVELIRKVLINIELCGTINLVFEMCFRKIELGN